MAAGVLLSGCGGDVRAKISVPSGGGHSEGNAGFEAYVSAAEEVEKLAEKHIGRTAWTPDQRDFIVEASAGAIRRLSGVEGAKFGRTWSEPFGLRDHTRGWRTVGRALAWRIESAIKREDYADARYCAATAVRMSNALATSDSHDAYMGLEIVDECIDALWHALPRFDAQTAAGLSSDLARLLNQAPSSQSVVQQERSLMLAQMKWVSDRYQAREFSEIEKTLGQAVDRAIRYLRDLAESQEEEQQAYFKGFSSEIEQEADMFSVRLGQAPAAWEEEPTLKTRAWMRFVQSFGTPWRMYVERRASVRTRMRLLAIDAALIAQFKNTGGVPRALSGFPAQLRTDPYSGRDFVYVSRGIDYKLYSVGPDKVDGGGDRGDISLDR